MIIIRKFLSQLSKIFLCLLLVYSLIPATTSSADEAKIKELEQKLAQTQNAAKTLTNEISKLDNQVELTTLRITQTEADLAKLEEEIGVLGGRIDRIRGTLTTQSDKVLIRIANTYKNGQVSPLNLFLSTNDFGKFLARYKYLKTIQQSDRKILGQLQTTKSSYTNQKETLEDKKVEAEKLKASLDALQSTLAQQKKDKEYLLVVTKNDEKTFQRLLAEARAEASAIFSSVTFLRDVNEGDVVGYVSIYKDAPGCSTAEHLHFETRTSSGVAENPANYLKNVSHLSPYGQFSPNGSWNWPIDGFITINQIFGVKSVIGNGIHAGIDIEAGPGVPVKAVQSGKLYAGSYNCNSTGYPGILPFLKLESNDGKIIFYQHVVAKK